LLRFLVFPLVWQLSLAPDDPRAKGFGYMYVRLVSDDAPQSPLTSVSTSTDSFAVLTWPFRVNDTSLYGPARCESAADVDNPFNACVLKGWEDGVDEDGKPVVNRIFDKVRGRPLSSTCVVGTRRGLCYTKRIGFSHINFEGVVADVW
jgi:hypothetical protein